MVLWKAWELGGLQACSPRKFRIYTLWDVDIIWEEKMTFLEQFFMYSTASVWICNKVRDIAIWWCSLIQEYTQHSRAIIIGYKGSLCFLGASSSASTQRLIGVCYTGSEVRTLFMKTLKLVYAKHCWASLRKRHFLNLRTHACFHMWFWFYS